MRKLTVRHERLPRIGERFELDTVSGVTVTIVSHRSGRHDLIITRPDGEEPSATATLTGREARAVAMLLAGAYVELTTTPR
jgi:K+/H+ antiporter YhaU regulatory subunit KhtT